MLRHGLMVGSLTIAAAGTAIAVDTVEQALRESDFIVDYRVRYESVDQSGFAETADAVTSRLRMGFQTASYRGTSLLVEGVWVEDLIDDYDSTTNGNTEYPVVADPTGFAVVNRLALINQSLPDTTLTIGRQRIVIDDSRFVGNVGWRQHEQTFDALRAQFTGSPVKIDLSYANRINRVFGPDSPAGRWEGDAVLANVARALPIGTLTLFDYYVDTDHAPAVSSNTVGMRLAGSKPVGNLSGTYLLSYAHQTDAGANPATYSEEYWLAEGGLTFPRFGAALGVEVLGGDGERGFATPLATLHAFQGWADKFLTTPAAGIEDRYVRLTIPIPKRGSFTSVTAQAMFHDFVADAGSADYGDELDLELVARTERLRLTLKYADYRAKTLFTDTRKFWMSIDYAL